MVTRGLERRNAGPAQVLLEGSPIPPGPIQQEIIEIYQHFWVFSYYFISSPHLGLTILSIKGPAGSLFGK